MARRNKPEKITEKPASEQIQAFSACGNFPKDRAGVEALASALQRWAQETGILMSGIVDECLTSSSWCPTPFDLRGVAMSMRDKIRNAREGSKRAEWERIYGRADPDWSSKMIEAAMKRDGHTDQRRAIRGEAIRNMLYYTEGEGKEFGDRKFWEGPRRDGLLSARAKLLRDQPAEVESIREAGGWHTERELQGIA